MSLLSLFLSRLDCPSKSSRSLFDAPKLIAHFPLLVPSFPAFSHAGTIDWSLSSSLCRPSSCCLPRSTSARSRSSMSFCSGMTTMMISSSESILQLLIFLDPFPCHTNQLCLSFALLSCRLILPTTLLAFSFVLALVSALVFKNHAKLVEGQSHSWHFFRDTLY